jgi:hypothetical protein
MGKVGRMDMCIDVANLFPSTLLKERGRAKRIAMMADLDESISICSHSSSCEFSREWLIRWERLRLSMTRSHCSLPIVILPGRNFNDLTIKQCLMDEKAGLGLAVETKKCSLWVRCGKATWRLNKWSFSLFPCMQWQYKNLQCWLTNSCRTTQSIGHLFNPSYDDHRQGSKTVACLVQMSFPGGWVSWCRLLQLSSTLNKISRFDPWIFCKIFA